MAGRSRGPEKMSRAALLGLAVHAYCLRPRALPWAFFRPAGPGEPSLGAWAASCCRSPFAGCQFALFCLMAVEFKRLEIRQYPVCYEYSNVARVKYIINRVPGRRNHENLYLKRKRRCGIFCVNDSGGIIFCGHTNEPIPSTGGQDSKR